MNRDGWLRIPGVVYRPGGWYCAGPWAGARGLDKHLVRGGWAVREDGLTFCIVHLAYEADREFLARAVSEFDQEGWDPAEGLFFHAAAWGPAEPFTAPAWAPRIVSVPGTAACGGRGGHAIHGLAADAGGSWVCAEHARDEIAFWFRRQLAGMYYRSPNRSGLMAPALGRVQTSVHKTGFAPWVEAVDLGD